MSGLSHVAKIGRRYSIDWRRVAFFGIDGRVHNMPAADLFGHITDNTAGLVVIDPPSRVYDNSNDDDSDESVIEDVTQSPLEDDVDRLREVALETERVLMPGASCIMLGDPTISAAWELAMSQAGMVLLAQIHIVWDHRDRWRRTHRGDVPSVATTVRWHVKKGMRRTYDQQLTQHIESNVLVCTPLSKEERQTPSQLPVELFNYLVSNLTVRDDLVVDPYCGSGSALVAAKMNDRQWVGGDIDKDRCDIARRRLDLIDLEEMYIRGHKLRLWIDGRLVEVEG